ncbi:MAG: flagellar assembly protein FliW [Candidatus Accumulibacter sp.]|jgi:flagellar assembly factor FliW|nr:flagellar assembly protein FliW [Accumulibacter sp.]
MEIDIKRYGITNVPVDADSLFTFEKGLAGFEESKRFKLFHEEGSKSVFWLQSVDDVSLTFPVVSPDAIDVEYQIELSDEEGAQIGLESAEDAVIAIIVYREGTDDGKIAANTLSPLILNQKTHKGMQKILKNVEPKLLYRAN